MSLISLSLPHSLTLSGLLFDFCCEVRVQWECCHRVCNPIREEGSVIHDNPTSKETERERDEGENMFVDTPCSCLKGTAFNVFVASSGPPVEHNDSSQGMYPAKMSE